MVMEHLEVTAGVDMLAWSREFLEENESMTSQLMRSRRDRVYAVWEDLQRKRGKIFCLDSASMPVRGLAIGFCGNEQG